MKSKLELPKTFLAFALVCAVSPLAWAGGGKGGTDVFHYDAKVSLTDENSAAAGRLDIKYRAQGNSEKGTLVLDLRGLEPEATYVLRLSNDLPAPDNVIADTPFVTDTRGRAVLESRDSGNGKAKNKKQQVQLPSNLELWDIRGVQVISPETPDQIASVILAAQLGQPGQFHYLVKQTKSADGAFAMLRVMSDGQTSQFRLQASGLPPSSEIQLLINGVAQPDPIPADEKGQLSVQTIVEPASGVLDISTLQLAPVTVGQGPTLSFELPK